MYMKITDAYGHVNVTNFRCVLNANGELDIHKRKIKCLNDYEQTMLKICISCQTN